MYEIGQILRGDKRDLVIIDRKYTKNNDGRIKKYYKYKCNLCGFECGGHYQNYNGVNYKEELWIDEYNLKRGSGCACCRVNPQIVVVESNSIWITDRWMCDLGVSEEDAKKYTRGSRNNVKVMCPDCKKEKMIVLKDLFKDKTIRCDCRGFCKDGTSYPEKFMYNLLNQLKIEFKTQLSKSTFSWCDKYKYDFYLPNYNIIIETHGEQHYEEIGWGKPLKEQRENDKIKKDLALSNGIEKYIIIDCRKSEINWIKNAILGSELLGVFNLSKIDWLKCEQFAFKNIIKEVCDYWNNKYECETARTIANNNIWGIKHKQTIIKYLKKGTKHGWCNYDPELEWEKFSKKKMVAVYKDDNLLHISESCVLLERQSENLFGIKLFQGAISSVCRGELKQYKGFVFKYINESNQIAS